MDNRNLEDGQRELLEVAELYEGAMGVPPQHMLPAGDAVLIEMGVIGGHENFPNGFVSILMVSTPEGWIIFDTGENLRGKRNPPEGVLLQGSKMYLKTGLERSEVERGLRKLVGVLQEIHGRCRPCVAGRSNETFQNPAVASGHR